MTNVSHVQKENSRIQVHVPGHILRDVLSACDVNVTSGDVPMFGGDHVVFYTWGCPRLDRIGPDLNRLTRCWLSVAHVHELEVDVSRS